MRYFRIGIPSLTFYCGVASWTLNPPFFGGREAHDPKHCFGYGIKTYTIEAIAKQISEKKIVYLWVLADVIKIQIKDVFILLPRFSTGFS